MRENLGLTGVDMLTGFQGVITAHIAYLSGCNQVHLQPRVDEHGEHRKGEWFDESRINLLEKDRVVLNPIAVAEHPGFDENVSRPSLT